MSSLRDFNWVFRFEQTQIFREVFGHCLIPQRYHNDPTLGSWICRQRYLFKNMAMNSGRQLLLKQLDFNQKSPKNFFFHSLWNKHYIELCYYKKIYGNCNVPSNFVFNKPLGFWVKNQRQLLKKKKMESFKVELLCKIGFEWERKKKIFRISWTRRYKELFSYFIKNGNVHVPQRLGSLGKWVQRQKDCSKKGVLGAKKNKLLLTIKLLFEI
jgi:hypothetical protein